MTDQLPEEILSDEIDAFLGEEEEDAAVDGGVDDGDDLSEVDVDGVEDDVADEGDEGDDTVSEPPANMPKSWSKDDAAAWGSMTPEQQAVVERRESERDKHLHRVSEQAAATRQVVENEAREVLARMQDNHAQALAVYAQQLIPQLSPPDQRLLYSNNPDDVLTYQRQEAAYRAGTDQQQSLYQKIAEAQRQADLIRGQAQQQEIASDAQRLREQLPEWFDPSEGPKLQQSLQSIGSELGYPAELMAQASSVDILALKLAADWKAKAQKYDAIVGKKMEAGRAAKGLPKMARPGVTPSKGQANRTARDQAWDRTVKASGRDRESSFADWAAKSGLL